MKRSDFLDHLEYIISDYLGEKIDHPDVLAELIVKETEKHMLPKAYLCNQTNQFLNAWEEEEN